VARHIAEAHIIRTIGGAQIPQTTLSALMVLLSDEIWHERRSSGGGTSSIGMATAVLAKQRAMTVLSTTLSVDKTSALTELGADHVLIDDGEVAAQVRAILPEGVDTALELIGTPTLPDTPPRHSTAWNGVLHRNAVESMDREGLLPGRRPPARRATERLRRRRR
jgi:NADPH:quinone reductase-like Zn-dependent oxidoreductase